MQETLRNTLSKILMAIIRCLLRNGMSYGEFDRVARKCYADIAFTEFKPTGKKQTISNIAILTGLNRKEVKKLLELDDSQKKSHGRQYNRVVRVLGGWLNDPRFLSKNGNPVDLKYEGKNSFSELVRQYSGDMPVAAMQKVLTASSNICLTNDGQVRLLDHAYLPSDDPVEKLAILGNDTSQLIETIDYNLTATEDVLRFQRKASNPKVAASSVREIQQFLRRKGQAFLEEIDLYLSQHESDKGPTTEISIGVYYHDTEVQNQEVKNDPK